MQNHYDVVILGGGIAGLSLARQLLIDTEKNVLLLEKLEQVPWPRQKVGEATVQVSGYYFSKVLDLEEYLLREHYMKYNLRFLWKTPGCDNTRFEDYGQSYIRQLSNIASYQLDRNKIEGELQRRNLEDPRYTFIGGIRDLDVKLAEDGPHTLSFNAGDARHEASATWVVDASGRARYLARRMGMERKNDIHHGSSWFWVDGLLNIEKLTDKSHREILRNPDRAYLGHLPFWLATNHFMGDGFWLWVIPLQGKTSIGLAYDQAKVDRAKVARPEGLVEWICEQFPLFGHDLRQRKIVDWGGYRSYSHDCVSTISASRWAMTGEAGRFTDPLYSPGGDLISIYNQVITAAIKKENPVELAADVRAYEQLMRAVYEAYVPSFAVGYHVLSDQEAYSVKYTWELTVYFGLYVFPYINELFVDRHFIVMFLARFSKLGPINHNIQRVLMAYVEWKRENLPPTGPRPTFFDFMDLTPLRLSEKTFYKVDVDFEEARNVLNQQIDNLKELARLIFAWVSSRVVDDEALVTNRGYVAAIDLAEFRFDPDEIRARWAEHRGSKETFEWMLDPWVMRCFKPAMVEAEIAVG